MNYCPRAIRVVPVGARNRGGSRDRADQGTQAPGAAPRGDGPGRAARVLRAHSAARDRPGHARRVPAHPHRRAGGGRAAARAPRTSPPGRRRDRRRPARPPHDHQDHRHGIPGDGRAAVRPGAGLDTRRRRLQLRARVLRRGGRRGRVGARGGARRRRDGPHDACGAAAHGPAGRTATARDQGRGGAFCGLVGRGGARHRARGPGADRLAKRGRARLPGRHPDPDQLGRPRRVRGCRHPSTRSAAPRTTNCSRG